MIRHLLAGCGAIAMALIIAMAGSGDAGAQTSSALITTRTIDAASEVAALNVPYLANGTIELQGTWVGTLDFESSIDDGATWTNLPVVAQTNPSGPVSRATSNDVFWYQNAGFTSVRVSATAWTSGTVTVVFGRGNPSATYSEALAFGCTSNAAINTAASGNVELVALIAGKRIRVCNLHVTSVADVDFQIIYGTGTACATGETNISGLYQLDNTAGILRGVSINQTLHIPASQAFCIEQSTTTQSDGVIEYAQF